jgi:type III secretory pathway component EscU
VATFATALAGPSSKLAGVGVLMAISTKLMRQFLFEIAANVALLTLDAPVLAAQREVRQIVVESAGCYSFPIFGCMALYTVVAETAAMRVLMARNAIGKLQAGILHESSDFP